MLIITTALLYLFIGFFSQFYPQQTQQTQQSIIKNGLILFVLILHGNIVVIEIISGNGFILNLINSLITVSFLINLLLLIASNIYRIYLLDLIVYPLTTVVLLINFFFTNANQVDNILSFELASHILLSLSAYAVLSLCFCQSILLSLQNKQLHHQKKYNFLSSLPALQTMESLLFASIATGVILLTLSLITGFVFLEDIFAQHLLHKTILSIIAWLIFIGILIAHQLVGLRGRQLANLIHTAFGLLLLAYFGSKFVLEYLL